VIKSFYLLVSFMGILCAGMFLHYMTFDAKKEISELNAIVAISGISSPSLSVAFYEPRILLYGMEQNPAYPEMEPIDRMDFVYEK